MHAPAAPVSGTLLDDAASAQAALCAESVRAALAPAVAARLRLAIHDEVDSTNSVLLREAAAGAPAPALCLAEHQTAGRGRRGRPWLHSGAGSLALSLLWRFEQGTAALAGLSLAAGVAACEALAGCGVRGVGLKWPNDLVAACGKLGGILVEAGGRTDGPCHAVIGIGINLAAPPGLQSAAGQPVAGLADLASGLPGRSLLAGALANALCLHVERFAREGLAGLAAGWARHDVLAGKAVRVLAGERVHEGIACGVDGRGALQLRSGGRLHSFDSAEVSVRAQ